jgi:predicted metal-dependent phosphoesterase TrpH
MSVWDDPELKSNGAFVSFDAVGDKVAGTITAIRRHKFDDGNVVPQILLTTDDGEDKTLTAGQIRLKAALVEKRPEAGDHLTVTLTQIEKRGGGKTLKHFDVKVKKGTGDTPPF